MYVPPLESLYRHLAVRQLAFDGEQQVQLSSKFFKFILQLAIAHCDFDEGDYLDKNPDVRKAVERGEVESGFVHYVEYGYFEGRRGGIPSVDEKWYNKQYPDVAAGIAAGKIKDATEHFYSIGAAEGRSPNQANEIEAAQWKKVLSR
jgi:hypothetical protein